ncbi:hypothetical protein HDK90DRAFT_490473 [Phyllosticta capitalensis]|uniref:Uncharacterized protein n=1 Tax=Phyllosticta capitalensis TaxID=121624 RepID=A0ABR1YL93_9PEZI
MIRWRIVRRKVKHLQAKDVPPQCCDFCSWTVAVWMCAKAMSTMNSLHAPSIFYLLVAHWYRWLRTSPLVTRDCFRQERRRPHPTIYTVGIIVRPGTFTTCFSLRLKDHTAKLSLACPQFAAWPAVPPSNTPLRALSCARPRLHNLARLCAAWRLAACRCWCLQSFPFQHLAQNSSARNSSNPRKSRIWAEPFAGKPSGPPSPSRTFSCRRRRCLARSSFHRKVALHPLSPWSPTGNVSALRSLDRRVAALAVVHFFVNISFPCSLSTMKLDRESARKPPEIPIARMAQELEALRLLRRQRSERLFR